MKLIGMLDSPYVRRTAISLAMLGVKFDLEQLSVFRTFEDFSEINPIVKAPTLVTDNGIVIVDSTLIIEYVARNVCGRHYIDEVPGEQAEEYYRKIGLSLAACEKALQVVYEKALRPPEKIYEPWLNRVIRQVKAAYKAINIEYLKYDVENDKLLSQPNIIAAIAWKFAMENIPDVIEKEQHTALEKLSDDMENRSEFRAFPYPEG